MDDYFVIEEGSENIPRLEEYMGIVEGVTFPIPTENNETGSYGDESTGNPDLFFFGISEETFLDESGDGPPNEPNHSWGTVSENVNSNGRLLPWLFTRTSTPTTKVTTMNMTKSQNISYVHMSTTPVPTTNTVSPWSTTQNTTTVVYTRSIPEPSTTPLTARTLNELNVTTGEVLRTATKDPEFNSLSEHHVIIISSVCVVFVVLLLTSLLLWFLLLRKKVRRRRVGVESQDEESEKEMDVSTTREHPEGARSERPSIAASKRSTNSSEGNNIHLHSAVDEPRRQAWTNGTNS